MSDTSSAEQAVQALLAQDRKILDLRQKIQDARRKRFALVSTYASLPSLLLILLVANAIAWRKVDMAPVNVAFLPILAALAILSIVISEKSTTQSGRKTAWESGHAGKLRLDLDLEIERKRLSAAFLTLPPDTRRHIYRETTPSIVEQYRTEGLHYRRIHNVFQILIIVGSLATSTVAGIAETPPPYKWITVGTSFAVGLSAGFTGYFKFRERSFYLQQTADAIEEEYESVTLGVGRYTSSTDEASMLVEFTQRVENLKSDQRKRQQQLDQPTENAQD